MKRRDIINIIYKESDSIAKSLDYELVDVEYIKEFGNYFLKIYIDKSGGISLEDCQIMSERLGSYLDENDTIKESYYLEVSSPGLDRPLKTDRDLNRNLNKEIEINLYKSINNKKNLNGKLLEFNNDEIIISSNEDGKLSIERKYISLIKLKVTF